MSKTRFPLELPTSVEADAEKVGTIQTAAALRRERSAGAEPKDLLPWLDQAPDMPPDPDDRLD